MDGLMISAQWILFIVLSSIWICSQGVSMDSIVARFSLPDVNNGEELQNFVVDTASMNTDRLYLSAINALYQLVDTGSTFQLKERLRTGPELDSPLCNYNGDCILAHDLPASKRNSAVNKTWTNNYNQILLIHNARKVLLACGTVKQGLCSVHRLENITKMVQMEKPVPVAANSDNSTTAAFLGPGPISNSDLKQDMVLYVGATFTTDPYRDTFPAVCTRSLADNRLFQLLDPGDVTGQSGLMIRNEYRSDFRIYYVGGFHSDSYAYWASVQRKSTTDPSSNYISKLLRVCTNDLRYESYSELPLECLGPDNSQYNIMKAFYVGPLGDDAIGNDDEKKYRRKVGEEFLVGVFIKGTDPWKYGTKSMPASQKQAATQSAVCAFSMKEIRAAFMYNLQRCNSGIGKWNLPHFGFDQKCYNITGQQQYDHSTDFCQPIRVGGEISKTSAALITYKDQLLTSITADVVGRRTVLFVGTGDGKIKKIYLQTVKNGREYDQIQLTTTTAGRMANQAVNSDLHFDRSKRYLYAMTPYELFKVRVETCAMYETCDACIGSGDPYCGWCTLENRCSTKEDCPLASVAHGFLTASISDLDYHSSTKTQKCPRIDSMTPMNASLYAPVETELKLDFNFLPPPSDDGGVYQCIFETKSVPAEFIAPKTLKCHLPPYDDRPNRIDGNMDESVERHDHIRVSLKIWSSASSAVFYETTFVFYDCSAYQLCTSCVSSRWPCDWCLSENRCIHDADACGGDQPNAQQVRIPHSLSRNYLQIMSKHAVHENRYRRGVFPDESHVGDSIDSDHLAAPSLLALSLHDTGISLPQGNQCPHIDIHELPEILLPNGYPVAVVVPVLNLEKLLPTSNSGNAEFGSQLECITKADDHEVKVRGRLSADAKTVQCENFAYHYKTDASTTTANFQLRTRSGTIIDRMQVRIYKCELLGSDCSHCLNSDPRFRCTWCDGRCQYRDACPAGTVPSSETAADACPAPVIRSIRPVAGPIEGGTKIEILGTDLGVRKQDVEGRIFIGGRVQCDVDEYTLAERVVCKTRAIDQPFEGAVEIRLDGQKVGRSQQHFQFVQPTLNFFSPNIGPRSGGTELTITGRHLLDASDVKVYIGALECKVNRQQSTSQRLICTTSGSGHDRLTLDKLTVTLDKANKTLAGRFDYTPDPQVHNVHPLSTFKSGGRRLTVRGKHFTSIQKPLMYFLDLRSDGVQLASEKAACDVLNSTLMICNTPPQTLVKIRKRNADQNDDGDDEENDFDWLDDGNRDVQTRSFRGRGEREPDLSKYEQYGLGFEMDGVESLRQLDRNRFVVTVVPDPIYEPFSDGKKIHRGEPLIIKGKNLNLASSEQDVNVTVGGEPCNVTLVAIDQLVCQPPSKKPTGALQLNGAESVQPIVIVRVGTLAFSLGQLVYDPESGVTTSGDSAKLDMALVGGVVGGCAALFVVAMVAAAVWWRKKSWQAEKEYKRIQLQMDTLESNVRQECKQAFAELQTDMSDLTGDLVALGIPFHTRRSYAAKTLFKEEHQAALRMLDWQHCHGNGYSGAFHHSLVQFEQLLWQKRFVNLMINALEQQPTFGSQDRVYMASLLTAALAKNMNYLTDLMLELLSVLIGKATQSKYPQLMLRRTESVVEKMLANWIALCMYDYMSEAPGSSLFLMFKALKHQVEKGPVDQLTADARYSLSEDRLLKEQIDSEPTLLRVVPPATETNCAETILCRVLSCDTISQVKSKILDALYRNTPFSSRPSISEIDLEWKSAGFTKPGVQLQDDDRIGSVNAANKETWRQLNTVQYYGLPNHAIVAVLPKQKSSNYAYASGTSHTYMSISSSTYLISSSPNGSSPNGNGSSTLHNGRVYGSVPSNHASNGGRKSPPQNCDQQTGSASNAANRYWHLARPDDSVGGCGLRNGSIPEIYLTRLLATKGTVQQFIDDFFASALKIGPTFPMAIKYLFDFLEDEAERRGVNDPSVVYAWKNNSLPLRFWVNIIKNPDFLLDIEKTPTIDACLSVIAQTFMDSCSAAEQRLGKDSPSNKLLFARDLPRYRQMFGKFYADVQRLPEVHLDELKAQMTQMSKAYGHELNSGAAVREILAYAVRYKEQIMEALETNLDIPDGQKLAERFEQTLLAMGRHSVV